MLCLPNKVLLRIFECLYYVNNDFLAYSKKGDLLASYATCRRFMDIRQGLAFKHITFVQDKEGYKKLLKILKSLYVCKRV
jgi:hypothetical protein